MSDVSSKVRTCGNQGVLISIIVPVFNEEDTIAYFLERAIPALNAACDAVKADSDFEIVFVDDGSTDKSADQIINAASENRKIKLISLSRNFGKDAALAAGLAHAAGDAIIPIDVDLQDPPELIPVMVQKWLGGAYVVNAFRASRSSDGILKRFTAKAFYCLYNAVTAYRIPHDVGDFRLIDREVVDILLQLPERTRFMKGLIPWVGFPTDCVDYVRAPRAAGQTKWRYWQLWNFALDGLTSATTAPLRIWTYIGTLVSISAFFYALYLIVRVTLYGIDTPGYASLMVVVLFLGGLNMLALGILGEYIGRISIEAKARPLYVIRSTSGFEANDSRRS
jgi:glycosyltransferase involved in cell wall biosynthesis